MIIILHSRIVILIQHVIVDQFTYGLQRKIGIHRAGSVSQKRREVMDLSRLSGFQDDRQGSAFLGLDKMLVHGGNGQQRRYGHMVLVDAPVGKYEYISALPESLVHFHKEAVDGPLQFRAFIIKGGDHRYFESFLLHVLDLQHIGIRQDRMHDLQHLTVLRLLYKKVAVLSRINTGRGDDLLTDRVDGRIGHLGEELFKIIKERPVLSGEHSQRSIHAHGSDALASVQRHIPDGRTVLFIGVPEGFLETGSLFLCIFFHADVGDFNIFQLYKVTAEPFPVRLHSCVFLFQFIVVDDSSLHSVHQQHFPRMETFFQNDLFLRNRHDAHLGGEDHIPVGRDIISGWPKSVAVQYRAHHIPVGKQDGGRAVPWFHHGGVILIKISLFLGNRIVIRPGFGNGDHHRQRKVHAAHHKKFQCIVKHGGI